MKRLWWCSYPSITAGVHANQLSFRRWRAQTIVNLLNTLFDLGQALLANSIILDNGFPQSIPDNHPYLSFAENSYKSLSTTLEWIEDRS